VTLKTRAVILAGGEGTRLGVLTSKRAKPAVPYAGKYRIIDFPLSNCVNSNLADVFIIAQYRPHSLIEHIGAGGPWDLNRDFTGGVRFYTPYRSQVADWFIGTADAVQQNFGFIKRGDPDMILLLSGDHVYSMDYRRMIDFHVAKKADITMATIPVPWDEASRYGILGMDEDNLVNAFVEKPSQPPSNQANMGVYLFNRQILNQLLWEDHLEKDSSHDFGKDILPKAVASPDIKVYAYPYEGYWVDVGTINSYWQAHMDLLTHPPVYNLFDRSWIIHTRTEERPPLSIHAGAKVDDSLICDGCIIETGAVIRSSIISPGVTIRSGAVIEESIILTDTIIGNGSRILRSIVDKRVRVGANVTIGAITGSDINIAMVGRNSSIPDNIVIQPGGMIGTDVIENDFVVDQINTGEYLQTRRLPNEI